MSAGTLHSIAHTPTLPGRGLRRWMSRGVWALLDQASFSIANFLIILLLGRWLDAAEFGRFTIAYTVFILLATVYSALFIEAMMVYGPRRYGGERIRPYLGALLVLQAPVAVGIALLMAGVAALVFVAHSSDLAWTMLAMALAAPLVLLLWFARRPCYMTLDPSRAAIGGAAYLAIAIVALWAIAAAGRLSNFTGIAVMAVASGVVAIGLIARERIAWPAKLSDATLRSAAADHWSYGKWAMASGLLGLLPSQLCYLVLPTVADVEATGALRAVSNIILPFIQLNIAVCALLLPALASHAAPRQQMKLLAGSFVLTVILPAIAWLVLGLSADTLLWICYGDRYANYGWLVWIIGAAPPLLGASMTLNTYLQSQQRQSAVFYSSLASAGCAATLGVLLTLHDGLRGAAVSVCVSLAVAIVISAAFALSVPRPAVLPSSSGGEGEAR